MSVQQQELTSNRQLACRNSSLKLALYFLVPCLFKSTEHCKTSILIFTYTWLLHFERLSHSIAINARPSLYMKIIECLSRLQLGSGGTTLHTWIRLYCFQINTLTWHRYWNFCIPGLSTLIPFAEFLQPQLQYCACPKPANEVYDWHTTLICKKTCVYPLWKTCPFK